MRKYRCKPPLFTPILLLGLLAAPCQAQLLNITDSRVATYFGTQPAQSQQCVTGPLLFKSSDPANQNWGPDAPSPPGSNQLPGVEGIDWVRFDEPRVFETQDDASPGEISRARIIAHTFIENGIAMVRFRDSFVRQEAAASSCALLQSNFSVDFAVGSAGYTRNGRCFLRLRVKVTQGDSTSPYARGRLGIKIWQQSQLIGECNLDTGLLGVGEHDVNLSNPLNFTFVGSGTLRATGFIRFEGDPVEIELLPPPPVGGVPTVSETGAFLLLITVFGIGTFSIYRSQRLTPRNFF